MISINNTISVIVPIYNAELYLEQCLESIKNQTYKNFEVIMIDDGSTDKSQEICKKFSNSDKRFKLICQKNSGVSAARNKGISEATGKYIYFCDSDDFCNIDIFETIMNKIGDNELVCFGYTKIYKNMQKNFILDNAISDFKVIKNLVFESDYVRGYLWNKFFNLKIIKDNNIRFNENIHFCEDMIFVSNFLNYTKKIIYINKIGYNYRMRKNSVTINFFNKKNVSILGAYNYLLEYCKESEIREILKMEYLLYYYKLKKYIDIEKDKKFINEDILNEQDKLIKNKFDFKMKIKLYIIKYFYYIYIFLYKFKNKNNKNLFD